MKKIELNEVCKSCEGTGLYIGMAERDGAAIVCSKCKGTGCFHFVHEFDDFVARSFKEGVKRVFQTNPGIGIGESSTLRLEDFGGMPISDWLDGKPFESGMEDRKHTCPSWWYQCADYEKKPDWKECWESLGSSFSKCKYFTVKHACWERWNKEFKED